MCVVALLPTSYHIQNLVYMIRATILRRDDDYGASEASAYQGKGVGGTVICGHNPQKKLKYFFANLIKKHLIQAYAIMTTYMTFSDKERSPLANGWEREISIMPSVIFEITYPSGEHFFQGEKYRRLGKLCKDVYRRSELFDFSHNFMRGSKLTPQEAKKLGEEGYLRKEEKKQCEELVVEIQSELCRYKFDNFEEVRDALKATEGTTLVYLPSERCGNKQIMSKYWEGKVVAKKDGTQELRGGNKLGELWMEVRDN
jgi:predicted NAD-dependent protein-ADP-ribosyltransferase YbiA (DUF1768 family)